MQPAKDIDEMIVTVMQNRGNRCFQFQLYLEACMKKFAPEEYETSMGEWRQQGVRDGGSSVLWDWYRRQKETMNIEYVVTRK